MLLAAVIVLVVAALSLAQAYKSSKASQMNENLEPILGPLIFGISAIALFLVAGLLLVLGGVAQLVSLFW